jgi:hypothetical protein
MEITSVSTTLTTPLRPMKATAKPVSAAALDPAATRPAKAQGVANAYGRAKQVAGQTGGAAPFGHLVRAAAASRGVLADAIKPTLTEAPAPVAQPQDELLASSPTAITQPEDPQAVPTVLTLDGLLAAWGEGDSPYDLNGDGTVDVFDLLQFLQQSHDENSE